MEEVVKKERISENRKMAVEGHLIRIMKSKKSLTSGDLVAQVCASLHMFKPQPKFIKECITSLIDREYIKRDENDSTKLHYLA